MAEDAEQVGRRGSLNRCPQHVIYDQCPPEAASGGAAPRPPLCFLVFVFSHPPTASGAPGPPHSERSISLRPGKTERADNLCTSYASCIAPGASHCTPECIYLSARRTFPHRARANPCAVDGRGKRSLGLDGEATSTFLCAAPPRPRARPSAPSLRPSRRPSAGLQEPRGRQQRARSRSPTRARSVHMCVRRDPSPLRRMPAPRPKRHPLSRRRCGGERRREGAA